MMGDVNFPDRSQVSLHEEDGTESKLLCKCGKEASTIIMGKESCIGLCSDCQYGEDFRAAEFVYRLPD